MNESLGFVKKYLNVPYVISGSMAMKLYGNKYGVKTREPGNVNVVVNRKNLKNAYNSLYPISHKKVSPNTNPGKSKNHYSLEPFDLLRAGTNLAPSINTYVELNGIPLVSLENLLKQKLRSLDNAPENKKKNTIQSNIKTLKQLIEKSKRSPLKIKTPRNVKRKSPPPTTRKTLFGTPPSRSRTPSPTRKTLFGTPPHNMSFRTPSPPRGKKLMF